MVHSKLQRNLWWIGSLLLHCSPRRELPQPAHLARALTMPMRLLLRWKRRCKTCCYLMESQPISIWHRGMMSLFLLLRVTMPSKSAWACNVWEAIWYGCAVDVVGFVLSLGTSLWRISREFPSKRFQSLATSCFVKKLCLNCFSKKRLFNKTIY